MGIRERIIYALEQSKKTRQALADELGVGRGAVSDMLNKEGEFDSIKYLEACEKITGFRFEWLRTGKGPQRHGEQSPEERQIEEPLSIASEPPPPLYGRQALDELTRLRLKVERLTIENETFREALKIISGRSPEQRREDKPLGANSDPS